MKKIWKENAKLILVIIISVALASGVSYATVTMYASNTVSYDNTTSGLRSTNVQGALDEIYGAANNYVAYDERLGIVEGLMSDDAGFHNSVYRGKNVSSYMPSSVVSGGDGSIYDRIKGTNGYSMFEDLYVGDYIVANNVNNTVNGIVWRIAGFDIYYGKGYTPFTSHHVVIVPDTSLTSSYMNSTATTEGGYSGSYMYTTTLPSVLTTYITPVFGNSHVLSHQVFLPDSVATSVSSMGYAGWGGATNNLVWYDRQVDLMNEVQVTGTVAFSSSGHDIGADNIQFPLFRLKPEFVNKQRYLYWLRSVASSALFAYITGYGSSSAFSANASHGVRPYFYIG